MIGLAAIEFGPQATTRPGRVIGRRVAGHGDAGQAKDDELDHQDGEMGFIRALARSRLRSQWSVVERMEASRLIRHGAF